jgi:hypothetical protein
MLVGFDIELFARASLKLGLIVHAHKLKYIYYCNIDHR